jgi:transcriptional regulator with XRE-family HTH domain
MNAAAYWGSQIKKLVESKGFSQKTLALAMQINESQLGRYLNGKISPRLDFLVHLSDTLGIKVYELFGGTSPKEAKHLPQTTKTLDTLLALAALLPPSEQDLMVEQLRLRIQRLLSEKKVQTGT